MKRCLIVVMLLVLTSGCAMNRVVVDGQRVLCHGVNEFSFSVKDDSLTYVDDFFITRFLKESENKGTQIHKSKLVIYGELQHTIFERFLMLEFDSVNFGKTQFNDFSFTENKYLYDIRTIKGVKTPRMVTPIPSDWFDYFQGLLTGYNIEDQWYMAYGLCRGAGMNGEGGWNLLYIEPVPDDLASAGPDSSNWESPNGYTFEMEAWVDAFVERAESSFDLTIH